MNKLWQAWKRSTEADKTVERTREDFTTDKEDADYVFDVVGKSIFGQYQPRL